MPTRRPFAPLRALLAAAAVLALGATLASCPDKDKDDPYSHNTDGTTDTPDTTTDPTTAVAERSDDAACTFEATIDGLGTALLEQAKVTGSGPSPSHVKLSHDGVSKAVSSAIARGVGTDGGLEGWAATGFSGAPIGTTLDLDGAWTIEIEIDGDDTCEEAPPVVLTLTPEEDS